MTTTTTFFKPTSISNRLASSVSGVVLGGIAALVAMVPLSGSHVAHAAGESMTDFFSTPIDSAFSAPPLAMLTLSNDHQLYYKAYDDYSDLNGDGVLDLTYNHGIDYYGYFDYTKCYSYSTLNGYFEPEVNAVNKYCDGVDSHWSGNFLNWATMHRMDIVRKVLFGGKRYIDDANLTVLERVFLPNDAHSSAKYYNGPDIARLTPFDPPHAGSNNPPAAEDQGVTICNTTHVGNPGVNFYSQDVDTDTYPPLMRVAGGNYSLWNANERWQCRWSEERAATNANDSALSGIFAHGSNPSSNADGLTNGVAGPDFNVRVVSCEDGLVGTENCRTYPGGGNAVLKPAGLLQNFGGDKSISFGLVTGSHEKNLSGGVLRKNVSSIDDEVDRTTGQFLNTEGIIKTLNTFRIYGYNFRRGHYLDTLANGGDQCTFGLSDFPEGRCSNWGNPQTEIFLEGIRYLSGEANPIAAYQADDDSYVHGLTTAAWDNGDLITNENSCATLNIVSFNASYASKDSGALPDMEPAATNQTNTIGVDEGIQGNDFFVGENGADNNQLCTDKTIGNFADAAGICPEAPRVGGSYKIAGVAYEAHINDQYPGVEGTQVIDTYGVTLAPSTPVIVVDVPNSDSVVGMLPACVNYNPITQFNAPQGSCTLVDFKVVSKTDTSGKFYVNWEDSEAGGDYDQDMWGTIEYSVDTVTNEITVTTDVHAKSTPHPMGFGYIIAGTANQDGFHVHSGINNFKYPDRNGADGVAQSDATGVPGCPNALNPVYCGPPNNVVGFGPDEDPAGVPLPPTSHTYEIGNEIAGFLELPLFYAAKWGSFNDKDGSDTPNQQDEWDEKNNLDPADGNPDGVPDRYFLVSNPSRLVNSVSRVFEDLLTKTARAGSAAAVIANSSRGFGALFQAQYQPEFQDEDFNKVRWIGDIKAVFIDDFGLLREDSDGDAILDGYTTDKVVEFRYDPDTENTMLIRKDSQQDDKFVDDGETEHPLDDFKPIWRAGELLYKLTDAQANTQRAYGALASTGRYMLTSLGAGTIPFTTDEVSAANYVYFGVPSQAAAQNVVRFIRGDSTVPGFRNRSADFDPTIAGLETWRVADIVHAPALPVGPPQGFFDIIQGDTSYADFKEVYKNRRLMVIAGTNGGLIQAFNGGFFDETTRRYKKSNAGETAHELGAELWAYAPMNLLPHLQWLANPDYSHVYYVDGKPQAFDAKIFPDDADHPGGWGTVLVIGMRLGGGDFEVDDDLDPATDPITLRSAYVVLDITNPEKPPQLMAEITDPNLGFTTSTPDVIFRDNNGGANTWHLIFGSGPTNISDFTSNQNAYLFDYNLDRLAMRNGWPVDLRLANSFVGDVTGVEFDIFQAGDDFFNDPTYRTDAWYFGIVSGTPDAPSGKLYRWRRRDAGLSRANSFKLLLDPGDAAIAPDALERPNQAFMNAPTLSRDENDRIWVYAGTGRYEVKDDKLSDHQQSFYGILEPVDDNGDLTYGEVSRDDMANVTDIEVFTDLSDNVEDGNGDIQYSNGNDVVIDGETLETFLDLEQFIEENKSGWYHELMESGGQDPSTRNLSRAGVIGGVLVYADFTPSEELCEPLGESALNVVYYKTGTGHPGVLAPDFVTEDEQAVTVSTSRSELMVGRAMEPVFHSGTGSGDGIVTAESSNSNLSISRTEIDLTGEPGTRTSWHEIQINE